MINVIIDELTPCLKDSRTGDIVPTEAIRIKRKSFLKNYNKKNGWYVNWSDLVDENEIYALVLEGTSDVQGLVALKAVEDFSAVYISWMCTAPQNNKLIADVPKYYGVGGHLFAIASKKSKDYGFQGSLTGFAANNDLLKHYVDFFGAEPLGILHPYHFYIDDSSAKKIMEVYDYVWTNDEF